MKRLLLTPFWVLVVLVASYGAWRWVLAARPRPAVQPPIELSAVPVRTLRVEARSAALEVVGYGTLLPARRAAIATEVGGRLVEVHQPWRVGAAVEAGELLFAVDAEELELEVSRLDARLVQARAAVERAVLDARRGQESLGFSEERLVLARREDARQDSLLGEGHTSESARDRARAERASAEETVSQGRAALDRARIDLRDAEGRMAELTRSIELARARLAKTRVHAPFAGRIVARPLALGSTLTAGVVLLELIDVATLHLSVQVPEDELPGLRVGLPARVTLPARPEFEARASVGAIAPEADVATRTVAVEVDVPNPGASGSDEAAGERAQALAAGQFAQVRIEVRELADALLLERAHVDHRDGRPVVFVVEAEGGVTRARLRPVELGRPTSQGVLVLSGLVAGETLITAPLARLTDGAPIQVSQRGAPGER